MNSNANNIQYSKQQLEEATRRLDSVHERVTEIQKEGINGVIDQRTDELFVAADEVKKIPEEHREYLVISQRDKEVTNIEGHIQNVIIDCQMCIELSVKSMFKAAGEEFDYSHGINFESHNTKNFNREIPSEFPRKQDIIRAIFLTQLWERFYELAKYGAPGLNVGPSVIFDIEDAERAMNDASFCVDLAEDFIQFLEKTD